jgi:glycosidase
MFSFTKSLAVLFILIISTGICSAQCYPSSWWPGMKWNKVQLMLHVDSPNAFSSRPAVEISYPGIRVLKVNPVENKRYLFVDIEIAPNTRPGNVPIRVSGNEGRSTVQLGFSIKPRRANRGTAFAQGVTNRDFIYLIMPDRFSNGDPANDRIPGMRDQSLRRDTVFNRHGGDLQGIRNHLDYLHGLGVTTLWLNPVWENDMPSRTEHGYAFTNHYKVDPRLGGDKAYLNLVDAAHEKGMKVIQDAVYNHVGLYHHTVQDLPMKDWLHQWEKYTNTTYKDQVLFDPYASPKEVKVMADGWFTPEMPDLNQHNPYVEKFLIQHALWSVEQFGIDGWRIDTYAYNDLQFMNRCNKALLDEYPRITLFGETWVQGVPNQAFFTENNLNIPYRSNLPGVTDFQTLWGIQETMTKDFGWTEGVNRLYTTLAQDFLYKDPSRNVIFLDNHDINRFYSTIGENMDKYKTSLSWLFTCRGIPQMYYSSELATTGFTSPSDGYVRQDFPGGWPTDSVNKFLPEGRKGRDADIWNHVAALANFRKKSSAMTTGKMMQYLPVDGVYVYFRYDASQTVMVAMNTSKEEKTIDPAKYAERVKGFTRYKDIIAQAGGSLEPFKLGSFQTVVYELTR